MFETYVSLWEDGLKKWILKKDSYRLDFGTETSIIEELYKINQNLMGCDIKSDWSKSIINVTRGSLIFYEFNINTIVSVNYNERSLYIESEDTYTVRLNFISEGEARKALQRILLILNGKTIVGCNDERLFDCKTTPQIGINFV